ncbi:MFS transporter [Nocardioides anomalus]|uniref:MFS transporter n=1 Tax=Nocardioides anomalus TaxID=2712223 RepID=A0A6G6WH39_9ACTN|nr:MFS transporter [Nocardioides anomalus]QIG44651.1 MFS transporter [Nocardioides anomalus]
MRGVRRLLAGYACASVAIGLPWPLLVVAVWDQGPLVAGLTGAARMAPYVLLSWAVGSIGDHVRRDRLVRVTLAGRVLFLGAAALALAAGHTTLAVVGAALAVAVGTPTYPAIAAALPAIGGPQRVRATELLVTIEVAAWVVGPALGGLLLAAPTRPWTLAAGVALAALGLVLSTGVTVPGPADRAPHAVAGMLRHVFGTPAARGALALAGLLNLVVTATGLALLPLCLGAWGTGQTGFGTATACLGLGALAAPLLSGGHAAVRGPLAMGAALVLVAVTPVHWVVLPVLALAGATGVLVESRATGALQDAVPDHHRAGALGLMDTVMVGACLIGSLVAPALVGLVGGRVVLLLAASAVALTALAALRSPYDARDDRPAARPDPRGAPAVGAARVG